MYEELILTVLMTSVPLVYAAIGELVVERSGVLNLGVEGMMLMGISHVRDGMERSISLGSRQQPSRPWT